MTHDHILSSERWIQWCPMSARRPRLILSALLLTAGAPSGALAGETSATDAATVTIRVSVLPHYSLARASRVPLLGDEVAGNLCIRTNAAWPSLPVTGAWLGRERVPEFVLPSCGNLHLVAARERTMDDRRNDAGIFLVRPE